MNIEYLENQGSTHKERMAIETVESMMSGFHELMHLLVEGKSPEFLEGFLEGMITMKTIDELPEYTLETIIKKILLTKEQKESEKELKR